MELHVVMMDDKPFRAFHTEKEAEEYMEELEEESLHGWSIETTELETQANNPINFTESTTKRVFRDILGIASNNIGYDPNNSKETILDGAKRAVETGRPIVFTIEDYKALGGDQ